MSIYYPHFAETCRTVLEKMSAYSEPALTAITMIVAHESLGGRYWKQLNGGPALGIIQMEPWVHDDVWTHADNVKNNAAAVGVVRDVNQLRWCMRYNIFMARQRLLMDRSPLPDRPVDMAEYLKRYWNSDAGKASAHEYLSDYTKWINS